MAAYRIHTFPGPGGTRAGMALLLVMSGCSSVKVGLGMRVRMETLSLAALEVALPAQGMGPGERQPLVVTLKGTNGVEWKTEGEGHGPILWEELRVSTNLGSVDDRGRLSLPADPRLSEGRMAHLTVTAPSHPDLCGELDVPVRYDRPFVAQFSGRMGHPGSDGSSGHNGSPGHTGSFTPGHLQAGGNGGSGGRGGDGHDGGRGEDGPDVRVEVAFKATFRPLLQVAVSDGKRREFFLVDPQGGSLRVQADGGPGGPGGKGGHGGHGGSGGSGSPSGSPGMDGSPGLDGHAGIPGRAGTITVCFDPQAKPYLGVLQCSNRDGRGRPGPEIAFIETPVSALW